MFDKNIVKQIVLPNPETVKGDILDIFGKGEQQHMGSERMAVNLDEMLGTSSATQTRVLAG